VNFLRRPFGRIGLVLSLALIGACAAWVYAATATPSYTARAYLVTTSGTPDAVHYARVYARLATSAPVRAEAAALLGTDSAGLDRVTAATPGASSVIEIAASNADAARAVALADAEAQALADYGSERLSEIQAGLSVFALATAPTHPSSPSRPRDLLIGVSAGLLAGALAALLTLRRPATGRPTTGGSAIGRPDPDLPARRRPDLGRQATGSPDPGGPNPRRLNPDRPATVRPGLGSPDLDSPHHGMADQGMADRSGPDRSGPDRSGPDRGSPAKVRPDAGRPDPAERTRPTFEDPAEIAGHLGIWRAQYGERAVTAYRGAAALAEPAEWVPTEPVAEDGAAATEPDDVLPEGDVVEQADEGADARPHQAEPTNAEPDVQDGPVIGRATVARPEDQS
jgi:capsular polysaccharide biosynthesis protein